MKIDTDGKIAIPPEVQERLGLRPGTEIQLEVMGDTLQIRKPRSPNQGAQLIAAIRGKSTSRLTTNDIMTEILVDSNIIVQKCDRPNGRTNNEIAQIY